MKYIGGISVEVASIALFAYFGPGVILRYLRIIFEIAKLPKGALVEIEAVAR